MERVGRTREIESGDPSLEELDGTGVEGSLDRIHSGGNDGERGPDMLTDRSALSSSVPVKSAVRPVERQESPPRVLVQTYWR
jgi:hypothetical protein